MWYASEIIYFTKGWMLWVLYFGLFLEGLLGGLPQ